MDGGDFIPLAIIVIYWPLIVYPLLGIPFMVALVAWLLLQRGAGNVCLWLGWQRPDWAVWHTERAGFENIDT